MVIGDLLGGVMKRVWRVGQWGSLEKLEKVFSVLMVDVDPT